MNAQVSWMFETGAVSHEVCLWVLFNDDSCLRQALYTNLYSSHSHRYCLFCLVSGRKLSYSLSVQYVVVGSLRANRLLRYLDDLAVSQHPRPDGVPTGVQNLQLGDVATELLLHYSNTHSS